MVLRDHCDLQLFYQPTFTFFLLSCIKLILCALLSPSVERYESSALSTSGVMAKLLFYVRSVHTEAPSLPYRKQ